MFGGERPVAQLEPCRIEHCVDFVQCPLLLLSLLDFVYKAFSCFPHLWITDIFVKSGHSSLVQYVNVYSEKKCF